MDMYIYCVQALRPTHEVHTSDCKGICTRAIQNIYLKVSIPTYTYTYVYKVYVCKQMHIGILNVNCIFFGLFTFLWSNLFFVFSTLGLVSFYISATESKILQVRVPVGKSCH